MIKLMVLTETKTALEYENGNRHTKSWENFENSRKNWQYQYAKELVVLACEKIGGISIQMVVVLISARILKMVLDQ